MVLLFTYLDGTQASIHTRTLNGKEKKNYLTFLIWLDVFDASVAPPPSNSPQDMRYMGDQDGRLIRALAPPSNLFPPMNHLFIWQPVKEVALRGVNCINQ